MSPHEVLTFKFYERYENYLKNSYISNSSLFIENKSFFESNYTPLYDNSNNNFIIRFNNKKKAWGNYSSFFKQDNFFTSNLSGMFSYLNNSDSLFLNRKKQYATRKSVLAHINPDSAGFEKSYRSFTDLNESSR